MNKEPITCTFRDDMAEDASPCTASQLQIQTFSRKIKLLDTPPSNIFFRTHQYEFRIRPTKDVFEGIGSTYGFFIRLRLINALSDEERLDEEAKPLIDVSFEERPHDDIPWLVRVGFLSSKQYRWISKHSSAEEFYWKFDVYHQKDKSFTYVCTRCSNNFRLYSKPEVYLKQVGKCGKVTKPLHAIQAAAASSGKRKRKRRASVDSSLTSTESSTNASDGTTARPDEAHSDTNSSTTPQKGRVAGKEVSSSIKTKTTKDNAAARATKKRKLNNDKDSARKKTSSHKPPAPEPDLMQPSDLDYDVAKVIVSLSQEKTSAERRSSMPSRSSLGGSIIKSSFVEREMESNHFDNIHGSSGDFLSSLLSVKGNPSLPTPPLMQSTPLSSVFLSPNKSQKDSVFRSSSSQELINPLSSPNLLDIRTGGTQGEENGFF